MFAECRRKIVQVNLTSFQEMFVRIIVMLMALLCLAAPQDPPAPIDISTWAVRQELRGHEAGVTAISFSPQGDFLASASMDGTAKVWSVATGQTTRTVQGAAAGVYHIAFHPANNSLALSTGRSVRLLPPVGTTASTLIKEENEVRALSWSGAGEHIATGTEDRAVRVWRGSAKAKELKGHTDVIRSTAFSPDGLKVVSGSNDGTARVWSMETGQSLLTLRHDDWVCAAQFSPDGTKIVTGGADDMAKIWDASTGQVLAELRGHFGRVYSAAWSPDGRFVVTGSNDGSVKVWSAAGQKLAAWTLSGFAIRATWFSPDGKMIAAAGDDKVVRLIAPPAG